MNSNAENSSKERSVAVYSIPRTVVVVRKTLEARFGFALQSYVFQRSGRGFTEQLTYVDYVDVRDKSPAAIAGIKRGDVILSVNGFSAIGQTHSSLVTFMKSLLKMKLVLLFQNITKIVQLSARSIQLQYILREKEILLEIIELEEKKLLQKGATCSASDLNLLDNGQIQPQPSKDFGCKSTVVDHSDSVTRL